MNVKHVIIYVYKYYIQSYIVESPGSLCTLPAPNLRVSTVAGRCVDEYSDYLSMVQTNIDIFSCINVTWITFKIWHLINNENIEYTFYNA